MELAEAIKNRFAERNFLDKSVSKDMIQGLVRSAIEAPCSCNLQLVHYVVVDNPELREKLAKIATRKVLWAPVNIFFFLDPRFTVHRHSAVMGLGASMQNISLTAVSMGLGTCPMAGFKGDSEIKKLLGVPDFMEAILIMGVGHPKESFLGKKRHRLSVEEITHFNSFSGTGNFIKESDKLSDWDVSDLINYRKRIGPVYRYGERFSLQIFQDSVYEKAAELFVSKISKDNGRLLDLFTYDSRFVKALKDVGCKNKVVVSDYFPDVTTEITKMYSDLEYMGVDDRNSIASGNAAFEAVSLIQKIQFTPNLESLFKEVSRVLKSGGRLLVTFEKMSLPKKLVYSLRRLFLKYIKRKPYNVYESNPYYKIGPHRPVSLRKLKTLCQKNGLVLEANGVIDLPTDARFKSSMTYAIFKK